MARPQKIKHYVLVARPRIETMIVEVAAVDDADAERAALAQAKRLPASAWSLRRFSPAEYRAHVETMVAEDELAETGTAAPRAAAEELAETETRYVLLKANCGTAEGDVLLQPWLEVDQPDLLASDLTRDWLSSLQQLGLTHMSERLDDLTGGAAMKPSDRVLFSRPPRKDDEF